MEPLIALLPIVNAAVLIGSFIYFATKGGSKASNEVIEIFKLRDEEQKATIKEYQEKFEKLTKEFGVIQGGMAEKDQKLREYITIFQNRNPEMTEFIARMTAALSAGETTQQKANDYMELSTHALLEIKEFMKRIDAKLEEQSARNDRVDHPQK